MATTIAEKTLAKSHRGSVVDLLNSDSQSNVIGIESVMPQEAKPDNEGNEKSAAKHDELQETRHLLSLVTTDELIANISRASQDTQNNAKLISSIEDMKLFEAKSGGFNPDNKVYRVRLIDYHDAIRRTLSRGMFCFFTIGISHLPVTSKPFLIKRWLSLMSKEVIASPFCRLKRCSIRFI
ncbi:MAG: hypothetical protein LIO71_00385 [Ruminococcus sp.]|nr:hypothetical protein [Ruminococcus sp.]